MTPTPLTFGDIAGHPEGTTYKAYRDLHRAGVHRPTQKGIGGRSAEGADSIVLNGGYKDDVDNGDVIFYTGEGGQDASGNQISDQDPASSGNAALRRSHETGLPVRVIRGHKGHHPRRPKTGYRYDGQFVVTAVDRVRSSDGPWVFRYTLEQTD